MMQDSELESRLYIPASNIFYSNPGINDKMTLKIFQKILHYKILIVEKNIFVHLKNF